MSETPENRPEATSNPERPEAKSVRPERVGKVLYFLASGLLVSFMVSCACGPVR